MRSRARKGIMLVDAVMGIALLAMIGLLLTATVAQIGQAGSRLRDSRAAVRAAEHAMAELQLGHPLPVDDQRTEWRLTPLAGRAPGGQAWVELRVVVDSRDATLVGVVPASSLKEAAP